MQMASKNESAEEMGDQLAVEMDKLEECIDAKESRAYEADDAKEGVDNSSKLSPPHESKSNSGSKDNVQRAAAMQKGGEEATLKNGTAATKKATSNLLHQASKPKAQPSLTKSRSKNSKSDDGASAKKNNTEAQADGASEKKPIGTGSSRLHCTVPQPFQLSTDKRAAFGSKQTADGEASSQKPLRASVMFEKSPQKTFQVTKKTTSKPQSVKSTGLENDKHSEAVSLSESKIECGEEDETHPVTSVQSQSNPLKVKSVAVAGVSLKSDERPQKLRQELASKVVQKPHVKEEGKNQVHDKSKEGTETEAKQLRKSSTFKATPMPSFYQEEAPPKVEIKKVPLTRAKSPKLGRRSRSVGADSDLALGDAVAKVENSEKSDGGSRSSSNIVAKSMKRSSSKVSTGKALGPKHTINTDSKHQEGPNMDNTHPPTLTSDSVADGLNLAIKEATNSSSLSSIPNEGTDASNATDDTNLTNTEKNSSEKNETSEVAIVSTDSEVVQAKTLPPALSTNTNGNPKTKDGKPKRAPLLNSSNATKVKTGAALHAPTVDCNVVEASAKGVKKEKLKAALPTHPPLRSKRGESGANEASKHAQEGTTHELPSSSVVES